MEQQYNGAAATLLLLTCNEKTNCYKNKPGISAFKIQKTDTSTFKMLIIRDRHKTSLTLVKTKFHLHVILKKTYSTIVRNDSLAFYSVWFSQIPNKILYRMVMSHKENMHISAKN